LDTEIYNTAIVIGVLLVVWYPCMSICKSETLNRFVISLAWTLYHCRLHEFLHFLILY